MSSIKTLKYEILPELNLIIDCWFGEMTFDKILSSKLEQVKDARWKQGYNNISDIRNAEFLLSDSEAKKIIEYTRSDTRWQHKRKTAYITNNPNQVVFETFLEFNKSKDIPNKIRSFSTLGAALRWMQIDLDELVRIKDILIELAKD